VVGCGDCSGTNCLLSGDIQDTHNPGSDLHDPLHLVDSCDSSNSSRIAASGDSANSLDGATYADGDADNSSAGTSNHDAHDRTDNHDDRAEYGRGLLLTAVARNGQAAPATTASLGSSAALPLHLLNLLTIDGGLPKGHLAVPGCGATPPVCTSPFRGSEREWARAWRCRTSRISMGGR
jgi:hypothetical protein